MLVWGPAEACGGAWTLPDAVRRPLEVASFLFLRCSSSCLFCFSEIQLEGAQPGGESQVTGSILCKRAITSCEPRHQLFQTAACSCNAAQPLGRSTEGCKGCAS